MQQRRLLTQCVIVTAALLLAAPHTRGQADTAGPPAPRDLEAVDRPWDKGEKIDLRWALPTDEDQQIAFYRVYRSLTSKSTEQLAFEEAMEDLVDLFETPDASPSHHHAALQAFLPELRAAAERPHARQYDYDHDVMDALAAAERYLAAPADAWELNRRAGVTLSVLDDAIPRSEVQQRADDREEAAERAAKNRLTAPVLHDIYGRDWKEQWHQWIDEMPTEVRRELCEARLAAEAMAESAVRAEAAARAGELRWKMALEVEPTVLERRRGTMSRTVEMLDRFQTYHFMVVAVDRAGLESAPAMTGRAVRPLRQAYDGYRFALMIIVLIICGAVVIFIQVARSGRPLNVRKIAGLSAVDEAVGRATEMGRSILFVAGIQDMNDIQTIAGITVLSRVAKLAAEYDAKVEVPTARSLVMTAARETVQAAHLEAGRPDTFNPDNIYYVTDEQFGFVAYLQGTMVREKPAACFYMGTFFAESLILAETGNAIGAIQIAGTAMPAQLPFFVAACDYTLIGEEFFAASAYLSDRPTSSAASRDRMWERSSSRSS